MLFVGFILPRLARLFRIDRATPEETNAPSPTYGRVKQHALLRRMKSEGHSFVVSKCTLDEYTEEKERKVLGILNQ